MRKIKSKIIIAILICSILISAIIGGISLIIGENVTESESNDKLVFMAESNALKLNKKFEGAEYTIDALTSDVLSTIDLDKLKTDSKYLANYSDSLCQIVKGTLNRNSDYIRIHINLNPELTGEAADISICNIDKKGNFQREEQLPKDKYSRDNKDMEWYYKPIELKKGVFSLPHISPVFNKEVISYEKPIFKDNLVIGVVGLDFEFDNIKKAVKDIKVYNTGYAVLYNEKFDYLVHPDFSYKDNLATVKNGLYKNIYDDIKDNNSGYYKYKSKDGKTKILGYAKLSNGWVVTVAPPIEEIFKPLQKLRTTILIIMSAGILVSVIVALWLGKKISKPIVAATEIVNNISTLNLIYEIPEETKKYGCYKDETGVMITSIINLKNTLVDIIEKINTNSTDIFNHSEKLTTATENMTISIDNVSKTVEELASGASEQASDSNKSADDLEDLGRQIHNVTQNANSVKVNSYETKKASIQGHNNITLLVEKFAVNNDVTSKVSNNVDNLSNKSTSIGDIVKTIQDIANQTNLLALNAAIESARAGDAGKQFAVVAEEIRKLSDETSKFTKEIASIVNEIQKEINYAKTNMDNGVESINDANNALSEVENAFGLIEQSIDTTINQIDTLAETLKKVDINKERVISSVKAISNISEESAASTEEVSSSIDEQLTSMESIKLTTEKLNDVATRMTDIVNLFKI